MSWCPFAEKMELQPESNSQPAIVPDQFILHSIVAPWTPQRTYEYWRDSTNLESHFGLGYGAVAQFIGTQTRADANGVANRRSNGHGAVSLESASNLQASDPWNSYQIDMIVRIGIWLHEEHMIPLRICRTWDDPGYGYHRLHGQWNPDAHSCPGDARVEQFHEVIFPRIKNGEGSMAEVDLTDAAIAAVAQATANKLIAGGGVLETTDVSNVATATAAKLTAAGGLLDTIRVQGATNGTALTNLSSSLAAAHGKLDAVKATLDAIDLSDLPADIAAKLNGLKFVIQEGA